MHVEHVKKLHSKEIMMKNIVVHVKEMFKHLDVTL